MKMSQLWKVGSFAVIGLLSLQSCEKYDTIRCDEPIDGPAICGVGDEEPAYCNTAGEVVYLPSQCAPEPSDVKGIRSEDGEYYMVTEDHTGKFEGLSVGTSIVFQIIESKEPCGTVALACHLPAPAKCGVLNCLRIGDTPDDGGGSNGNGDDPDANCNTTATVVSYTHTGSDVKGDFKLLRINGKHYAIQGSINNEIKNIPDGTEVSISYVIEEDCFLPMVITTPTINGCVRLGCFDDEPLVRN